MTAAVLRQSRSDSALRLADSTFNSDEVARDEARWGLALGYADKGAGVWFGDAGLDDVVGFFMSNILLSGTATAVEQAWESHYVNAQRLVADQRNMPEQVRQWNQWMKTMQDVLNATFETPPQLRPFTADGVGLEAEMQRPQAAQQELIDAAGVLVEEQEKLADGASIAEEGLEEFGAPWDQIADELSAILKVVLNIPAPPTLEDIAEALALVEDARSEAKSRIEDVFDDFDNDPAYQQALPVLESVMRAIS